MPTEGRMKKLSLQTFLTASPDFEHNQYEVLGGLKPYIEDFSHNKIYPGLGELIELNVILENLIEQNQLFRKTNSRVKEVDLENKQLIFEAAKIPDSNISRMFDLIEWALPHLRDAIREGTAVYDFVEENIEIEGVGILPMYRDEGYFIIPENKNSMLHVFRYELSLYTSGEEKFRTLKTHLEHSIQQGIIAQAPESIKYNLVREHEDLPNPATYFCETDLDFPFAETLLPVAKRKFIQDFFS